MACSPRLSQESLQHRSFLMAHAASQDSLVQAYRVQLAMFEAVAVLLVGVALLAPSIVGLQLLALAFICWQHHVRGRDFRESISFRQKDVDWAQREILLAESELPAEYRTFTKFKVYQDRDPSSLAGKVEVLLTDRHRATAEEIDRYLGTHTSQSRSKAARLLALPAIGVKVVAAVGALGLLVNALA